MTLLDETRDYEDTAGRREEALSLFPMSLLRRLGGYLGAVTGNKDGLWRAESYVALMHNLVKSSGIYALASLVSPLVALVLAPFLTHHLSRTDYGALVVLNTAILLVTSITQLGLASAFFRAYNRDYESRGDRLGVVATAVFLSAFVTIPATMVGIVAAPQLAIFLFNSSSFTVPIRLAVCVVLLQNLTVPGLAWLRAENRAVFFVALSIVNLVVNLCGTIVLVGMFNLGIAGSLVATAGGYACIVFCTLPVMLVRGGLRPRFDIAWSLLSFGLPVAGSFVSYWVLQLSDRYLLSYFGSLAQTASYSVAYVLGGALTPVVITPFTLAWPYTMYAIAKKEDAVDVFRLVFRWFSMILLYATFVLSFIAAILLDILFPVGYHAAAPIIPLIALSTMLYGVYMLFTVGLYIQRKTWYGVVFMTLAALVNVGLNIVLIPLYGSMGAAVSTLIAYVLLALIAYVVNQRIYPVPFEIGIFMTALLVGIVLYVGADLLAQRYGIYGASGIYSGFLAVYGGFLLLLARLASTYSQVQGDAIS